MRFAARQSTTNAEDADKRHAENADNDIWVACRFFSVFSVARVCVLSVRGCFSLWKFLAAVSLWTFVVALGVAFVPRAAL
jgi:hypothetical protein